MKYLFLVLCSVFSLVAYTQTAMLSGRIVDERGLPVEMANVLLLHPHDSTLVTGTLTDSLGSYQLFDLAPGNYLLRADLIGYTSAHAEPFTLGTTAVKLPALTLRTASTTLDEITVKARKPFIEMRAEKLILNVESSPVAAGNNALEILAKAPGVVLDQHQNISLRGKQGVLVYIDGKQTYMSTPDLVRLLQSTPASNVETIEIILSPSARYDAAGNAGIINIQMKRDRSLGFNGSARLGLGYGYGPKADLGLSLNYRNRHMQAYGEYSRWHSQFNQLLLINRFVPYQQGSTTFDQHSFTDKTVTSHNLRLGLDYFLGKSTTIGLMTRQTRGHFVGIGDNNTSISGPSPWPFRTIAAGNEEDDRWQRGVYNLNVLHRFAQEGRQLSVDFDYSIYRNDQPTSFFNYFFDQQGETAAPASLIRTLNETNIDIVAAKVDYTHPLGKAGNLEAGWKSSVVRSMNALFFERQDTQQAWRNDPLFTNTFDFDETIHAAYVNYQGSFGDWQLQAGLRAEATDNEGYSLTADERTRRDYLDLFPSLSLSRRLAEHHDLGLAYSRRIDRPGYQQLNPFVYFIDQFTYGKGNPFLQPQYANAYTLNYSYRQRYVASVGFSRTLGMLSEVIQQNVEGQEGYSTQVNIDQSNNWSLSLSAPLTVREWWTARLQFSGQYTHSQSHLQDYSFDLKNWGYNARLNQEFTLGKTLTAELSGFYMSSMLFGNLQAKPQYSVDAGISARLFDGRATLSANISDVFRSMRFRAFIDQGDLQVRFTNRWESRRANLTLRYNFGSQDVKQARRRQSASEAETQRTGG